MGHINSLRTSAQGLQMLPCSDITLADHFGELWAGGWFKVGSAVMTLLLVRLLIIRKCVSTSSSFPTLILFGSVLFSPLDRDDRKTRQLELAGAAASFLAYYVMRTLLGATSPTLVHRLGRSQLLLINGACT